jgi:hypothetical protein
LQKEKTGGNRRVRTEADDGVASIAGGTVATATILIEEGSKAKDPMTVDLLKLLLKWFLE